MLPKSIPSDISEIINYEAIELDERNFKEEFNRLVGSIKIARRDRLINAFINAHDEDNDDHVLWIATTLNKCKTKPCVS